MISFKKIKAIFSILLLAFLFSCIKSLEHEAPPLNLSCQCCEKADDYGGVYKGRLIEREYQGAVTNDGVTYPNIVVTKDSIIEVEFKRTFEGLNSIEDSLVCAFEFNYFFDEQVRITNDLNEKNEFGPQKFNTQTIKNDTINLYKISHLSFHPKHPWDGYSYVSLEFIGIKN